MELSAVVELLRQTRGWWHGSASCCLQKEKPGLHAEDLASPWKYLEQFAFSRTKQQHKRRNKQDRKTPEERRDKKNQISKKEREKERKNVWKENSRTDDISQWKTKERQANSWRGRNESRSDVGMTTMELVKKNLITLALSLSVCLGNIREKEKKNSSAAVEILPTYRHTYAFIHT